MTAAIPFVDEAAIRRALETGPLVDAMTEALIAFSHGAVAQPVRSVTPLPGADAAMLTKPAVADLAAVKVVTLVPGNAARGLPTHQAVVLAFDPETGAPLAVLEGTSITEIRTAAASAAGARGLLASPPRRVGVIGSGVQARSHVRVFRETFGVEEFALWSPNAAHAAAAAAEVGAAPAESAEAACAGADIVIAATSSTTPAVADAWLERGTLVVSVGAPLRRWRELDDALMRRPLYVDSREAALTESGDVLATGAEPAAEIGAVLAGDVSADRSVTRIFKSGGLAVEDAAAAKLVLDALGIGRRGG